MTDKKEKKTKKVVDTPKDTTKLHDSVEDAKEFIDEKADMLTEEAKSASKKVGEFTHNAEEKIDEVAQKAKAYIDGRGKEDFKELQKETGEKLDIVADGVEHVGEAIEEIAE